MIQQEYYILWVGIPITDSRYGFCGVEDDNERSYTTTIRLYINRVTPKMEKGDYRIVIFTPMKGFDGNVHK